MIEQYTIRRVIWIGRCFALRKNKTLTQFSNGESSVQPDVVREDHIEIQMICYIAVTSRPSTAPEKGIHVNLWLQTIMLWFTALCKSTLEYWSAFELNWIRSRWSRMKFKWPIVLSLFYALIVAVAAKWNGWTVDNFYIYLVMNCSLSS